MADLSDFLGHLLEEITRARVLADFETVRIAKMYVSDKENLLKHFPVPHMRLPNLEITAPVVISNVPDGFGEKADPGLLSLSLTRDVQEVLTKNKITIAATDLINVIKSDPSLSKGYLAQSSADNLSIKIGDMVKVSDSKTERSKDTHEQVVSLIREQLLKTISALPKQPMGVAIDATTSVIREFNPAAGQGANVVYLKMSISEEAMEIELQAPQEPPKDGDPVQEPIIQRLIPE